MTTIIEQARNDGYLPTMGGAYKIGENGSGVPFLFAIPTDQRDFADGRFSGRLYESQGYTDIRGTISDNTLKFLTTESPSRVFEAQMKAGVGYQGRFSIDSVVVGRFKMR